MKMVSSSDSIEVGSASRGATNRTFLYIKSSRRNAAITGSDEVRGRRSIEKIMDPDRRMDWLEGCPGVKFDGTTIPAASIHRGLAEHLRDSALSVQFTCSDDDHVTYFEGQGSALRGPNGQIKFLTSRNNTQLPPGRTSPSDRI
jgi:hypothetical protein